MVLNNQDITSIIITNSSNQVLCIISDENMFGSEHIKIFIENQQNEVKLARTADGTIIVLEPSSLVTTKELLEQTPERANISQDDFVTIDGAGGTVDLTGEQQQEQTIDIQEDQKEEDEKEEATDEEPVKETNDISEEVLKTVPQEVLQKVLAEFLDRTKQQQAAAQEQE